MKTIVLIRPIRAAIRAADSDETAASRFAPKKIAPRTAGSTPNCDVEPVGHQALRDEPAAERVDGEEDRQAQDDALRATEPEAPPDAVVAPVARRGLDRRRRAARTRWPSTAPMTAYPTTTAR